LGPAPEHAHRVCSQAPSSGGSAKRELIADVKESAIRSERGADRAGEQECRFERERRFAIARQVRLVCDLLSEPVAGLSQTREPRIKILIGRASELSKHQQRLLRELNPSLHHVEIMPFDVLARRARVTLDNVERYLLVAYEEAGVE